MTQIDFHSNVPERFGYVCRLVRKAYGAGQKMVVHGSSADLAKLDSLLWSFSALDFLPHCRMGTPAAEHAADTPIVLAAELEHVPHHDLLINLADDPPALFARFTRMIEVVGDESAMAEAGRQRYRFYRERGYPLTHHDIGRK